MKDFMVDFIIGYCGIITAQNYYGVSDNDGIKSTVVGVISILVVRVIIFIIGEVVNND